MINHLYIKSLKMNLIPDGAIKDKMNKVVKMLDDSGMFPLKYNIVFYSLFRQTFPRFHKIYKKEIISIKKHRLCSKRKLVLT